MRRPVLVVALCLVIVTAIRLEMGWPDRVKPGCVSLCQFQEADVLLVTGQVYQKNDDSITLRSVVLLHSDAFGQSAEDFRQEISCQENLICETKQAKEIPLGSIVTLEGVFAPFSRAGNPGEFDAYIYYRTMKIGGKLKKATVLTSGESCWPLREKLYLLKVFLKDRLYQVFPEKEAAVMSALLLGEKGELDGDLKDMYRRNGILHIFSISSLHITILGMTAYRLLRRLGLPVWAAAGAGSVLLVLYGCMTGFGVSACRAIGMYLLKMLSQIVGRTYDMLTALGSMAILMLASNPCYLQNSGFLLSFASVLGIGVLYPILLPDGRKGIKRLPIKSAAVGRAVGKGAEGMRQSFFAGLSITLATLPIQLWFYYEIPTYSVFLNLFVIPFLKPVIISGMLAVSVPGLEFLSAADRLILGGYEYACGFFESLPFHTWNPGCPGRWQVLGYYLLLAGAAALRHRKREAESAGKPESIRRPESVRKAEGTGRAGDARRLERDRKAESTRREGGRAEKINVIRQIGIGVAGRLAPAAVLCMAAVVLGMGPPPADSVVFLDVGQGDCILVRTASGQSYLFDCGSSSRAKVGKYVLLPYLKYCGIHALDGVFLSHPDADHANGILELLKMGEESGISMKQLVLPEIEEGARQDQLGEFMAAAWDNLPVRYLSAGDCWLGGSVLFTCLHPQEEFSGKEPNAYSECVLVEFKEKGAGSGAKDQWSLLLTGDVEGEGEEALLRELSARQIDRVTVLKVAHHGSRNSTGVEFLEQVSPLLAVISCGRDNSYGHPHPELLERLEEGGAYIMQTSLSGAVTVTFRKGGLEITCYGAGR